MRLGVTDHIDCAHLLPGHPKCGHLHGHTYRVEVVVEGEMKDGMVLDFADLKARIRNDFMDVPTVENICERLAAEIAEGMPLRFSLRVYEGYAKWAETDVGESR